MPPIGFVLDLLVATTAGLALAMAWLHGHRRELSRDPGWRWIVGGLGLLFASFAIGLVPTALAAMDLPGFDPRYRGRSPVELLSLGSGLLILGLGLGRWLPRVADSRGEEESLRQTNVELEERLRRGSKEMQLDRLRSEMAVRRHKRAARRSEHLIGIAIGGAPVALVATGLEGRIYLAVGRTLRTMGIDPDDDDESLAIQVPEVAGQLKSALDGTATEATIHLGRLSFQIRFSPLLDEEEQVTGTVMVATEITTLVQIQQELTQAKEAAEAANLAKSRFLANMSHELRTPLNSVIGFSRLLAKDPRGVWSEKEALYLDRIQENGASLLSLINDILDLSKIEAGHLVIEASQVEIVALVRETIEQLRHQARDGVELVFEPPDAPAHLETDDGRLRQILTNLLSNALKFTHQGQVVVRLHVDPSTGEAIALEVEDTGIGIPEDRRASIFEPFRQVDSSTSRQYGGTGLGLGISQSLCQRLGYGLGVESELDEGSTFRVDFTGAESPSRRPTAEPPDRSRQPNESQHGH